MAEAQPQEQDTQQQQPQQQPQQEVNPYQAPLTTPPSGLPVGSPTKVPYLDLPLAIPKNNPPLPSPQLAQKRADDATWALDGRTLQSRDDFVKAILDGREDDARTITTIEDSKLRTAEELESPVLDQAKLARTFTPIDPSYFWEYKYGEKMVDNYLNGEIRDANDNVSELRRKYPEQLNDILGMTQKVVAFNEHMKQQLENINELISKTGYISYGWNVAKEFVIPSPIQTYQEGFGLSGGSNAEFYALADQDLPRAVAIFDQRVNELKTQHNLFMARDYITAMMNHSQHDENMRYLFNAVDVAGRIAFPGVVTRAVMSGASRAVAEGGAMSFIKSVAAGGGEVAKPAAVVADYAAGNTLGAAVKDTARVMFPKFVPGLKTPPMESALDRMFTALDIRRTRVLAEDGSGLYGEIARRMYEAGTNAAWTLGNRLKNALKIDPLAKLMKDPWFYQSLYEEHVESGIYNGTANRILDFGNPIHDPGTNTYAHVINMGHYDGKPFTSEAQARKAMETEGILKGGELRSFEYDKSVKMTGLSGTTKQQGRGWYVQILQPVNRDSRLVDAAITAGKGNNLPESIITKWGGLFTKAIGPENTMAFNDILERKAATYMPNLLMHVIADRVQDISRLGGSPFTKQQRREWERVVKLAQKRINPENNKLGHWHETPGELAADFQSLFGHGPSDLQIGAYFALKDVSDIDWVARNARVYSNLWNEGVKKYTIKVLASGASWIKDRRYVESPAFHGVSVDELPSDSRINVARFGPNIDDMDMGPAHRIPKAWKDLAKNGEVKVIRIKDPQNFPLQGYGLAKDKDRIDYVAIKSASLQEENIDAVQVPYTGAGHLIPKAQYAFKQAHMRLDRLGGMWSYLGSTVFGMVPKHAEGKAFEKHFDELQRLTRAGDTDAVRQYHLDHGIPWDYEDWNRATKGRKDPSGKYIQPTINLKDPIRVMPVDQDYLDSIHGQALKDSYGDKFHDVDKIATRGHRVPFTQERNMNDLRELRNEGSVKNPVWKFEPADLVDPLPSLTRNVNSIIRSQWMDDHKMMTIKRFLDQAIQAKAIAVSPEEVRRYPFWYFHHPDELYRKDLDLNTRKLLEGNRFKIGLFTGLNSRTEAITHNYMQQLVDTLYERGHKWASDRLINIWDWAKENDPQRILRSGVFHKSLGLFSPTIMLLHMATAANGAMIAGPLHSMRGFVATWLHLLGSFNRSEGFLNALDKIATGMGWKPGAWRDANERLSRIPFLEEPGTYQLHEQALSSRLISTPLGKFLNAGLAPFNFGLKAMRTFSWYTAASEFRHGGGGTMQWAGKLGKMTQSEEMEHLARAELLSHNMSRASQTWLTSGWRATTMQFMTYHERLTNLALGTQLTKAEHGRFLVGNLLLYGIGGPLSLYTLGAADLLTDWNQDAVRLGYNPGQNGMTDLMLRGLPASVAYYASGGADKGFMFNVEERFGPKGFMHQFVGPKSFSQESQGPLMNLVDILGGPVVSSIKDAATAFTPFWRAITSMLGDSDELPVFNVNSGHIMSAFRRISSVNNAYTAYYAYRYGQWFTREGRLAETDIPEYAALIMAATGLRSQEQTDMYAKQRIMSEDRAAGQSIIKEMLNQLERGSQAVQQGNLDQADDYLDNAAALAQGLTYSEKQQVYREVSTDSEIIKTDNAYYNRNRVPEGQQEDLLRQKDDAIERRGHHP